MRSPAPARGARRAQMLLRPAAIPPAGHKEHTRDGTAQHSPDTAGRDLQGSSGEPSPGWQSSQPRGQDSRQPLGGICRVTLPKGWQDTLAPWKPHRAAMSRLGSFPDFFFCTHPPPPNCTSLTMLGQGGSQTPCIPLAQPPPAPGTEKGEKQKNPLILTVKTKCVTSVTNWPA